MQAFTARKHTQFSGIRGISCYVLSTFFPPLHIRTRLWWQDGVITTISGAAYGQARQAQQAKAAAAHNH